MLTTASLNFSHQMRQSGCLQLVNSQGIPQGVGTVVLGSCVFWDCFVVLLFVFVL